MLAAARRKDAPPIARGPAESLLVRWPGAFSVANWLVRFRTLSWQRQAFLKRADFEGCG